MTNSLLYIRNIYMFIQAIVISVVFLFAYLLDMKKSIGLFNLLICWNIVTYIVVFYNELKHSRDFHPFIIFALITLQYCGFSPIQAAGLIDSGKDVYLGATKITDYMVIGYLYLTLEHYLIFLGYFLYDNYQIKRNKEQVELLNSIEEQEANLYKIALYNYLTVLLLRLVNKFFALASISSVLSTYSNTGYLVSLAMLSYAMLSNNTKQNSILYWGITISEICLVLGGGMKQAIITPLLPYLIYLILAYKKGLVKILSFSFIAKCTCLLLFVIGFVFPYISSFRQLSIEQHKEWKDISVSEAISAYVSKLQSEDKENEQSGLEYFMSRAGSIGSNSFSVAYTDKNGVNPKYFLYTSSAIIPRVLWPGKPQMQIGSTAYYMSLGYAYDDALLKAKKSKNVTSITLGFMGSSYLAFGIIGALFFSLFAGFVSAKIWYFVKSKQYNIFAVWLFYVLIQTIFIDYESFVDCGLIFYVWVIVYVIFIKIIDNYYFRWKNNVYYI